jgi:hypothetical protein
MHELEFAGLAAVAVHGVGEHMRHASHVDPDCRKDQNGEGASRQSDDDYKPIREMERVAAAIEW